MDLNGSASDDRSEASLNPAKYNPEDFASNQDLRSWIYGDFRHPEAANVSKIRAQPVIESLQGGTIHCRKVRSYSDNARHKTKSDM